MPFSLKIETEVGILGIWELTETVGMLAQNLKFTEDEHYEFAKIKAEKRKKEYLATRLLLQNILNRKTEIAYHKSGKPFLKNCSLKITISHSAQLVAIIVSELDTGIDVENQYRKISHAAKRFLHKNEALLIEKSIYPQTARIIYWCAKEAIFKCAGFEGIKFSQQIIVAPFNINKKGSFIGKIEMQGSYKYYKLWYFTYLNNIIVYCVNNNN